MVIDWNPPGKNCGACGSRTCSDFVDRLGAGLEGTELCPFYSKNNILSPGDFLSQGNVLSPGNILDCGNISSQENISSPRDILSREQLAIRAGNVHYSGVDVAGKEYDFVLLPNSSPWCGKGRR